MLNPEPTGQIHAPAFHLAHRAAPRCMGSFMGQGPIPAQGWAEVVQGYGALSPHAGLGGGGARPWGTDPYAHSLAEVVQTPEPDPCTLAQVKVA